MVTCRGFETFSICSIGIQTIHDWQSMLCFVSMLSFAAWPFKHSVFGHTCFDFLKRWPVLSYHISRSCLWSHSLMKLQSGWASKVFPTRVRFQRTQCMLASAQPHQCWGSYAVLVFFFSSGMFFACTAWCGIYLKGLHYFPCTACALLRFRSGWKHTDWLLGHHSFSKRTFVAMA